MTLNRRDFFKGSVLLGTSLLMTTGKTSAEVPRQYRFPVLQGATSLTKTQINVMAAEEITIEIPGARFSVEVVQKDYSVWSAFRIFAEDLSPGKEYELRIMSPQEEILDTRIFSALKPGKTNVKVALASCMRDTRAEFQAPMWKAMEDQSPDVILFLGDNVYVDDEAGYFEPVTEERIWRRYVETRLTLDYYHWKKLIPTVATWDDHDFGKNNTSGATSFRSASTKVFRTLYAQDAIMPEVTWGPGIATSFTAHGQRFYFMDNRSYREMRYLGNSHWGTEQEEWLFTELNKARNPGWILTGSQVFGGYRSGWAYEETHPASLKKNLKRLQKVEAPVIFGSGDVHYSEVMKLESELMGYESIEITSSSMHSNAREPEKGNKRRLASIGEYNFVIAEVSVIPEALAMNIRSYGRDGKQFFEVRDVKVSR